MRKRECKEPYPATRLERHPIALTDGRFVIALTITYLGVSRDHSWKRERFYVAFGWERRSAATRIAFAVFGRSLKCGLEDT